MDLQEELKVTKRQRIRDLMKHPEQEELLEQTYDELEADLQKRIEGISHQIEMLSDKRNTIIQVNRAARTAMEVFNDILSKDTLERNDLELIIRQIKVYEDHLEIQLQSDVDAILRSGTLEGAVNFNEGMGHISSVTIVQESNKHLNKVFHANVISDGDPLEIYTDREGSVIFRKYSQLEDMAELAGELCETMYRVTSVPVVVTDRDCCIAAGGAPRKELVERGVSSELGRVMEERKPYRSSGEGLTLTEGDGRYQVEAVYPIISHGDVLGSVLLLHGDVPVGETEQKTAQIAAAFLGRHMES